MNKKEKTFLIVLLGLFIFFLFWNISDKTFFSLQDEKEIVADVIPIQSISPHDTNYTDLLFLEKILEGKRIVLLGEPTHLDGSVFSAKTRIIFYKQFYSIFALP
jgi:hypothetical protein